MGVVRSYLYIRRSGLIFLSPGTKTRNISSSFGCGGNSTTTTVYIYGVTPMMINKCEKEDNGSANNHSQNEENLTLETIAIINCVLNASLMLISILGNAFEFLSNLVENGRLIVNHHNSTLVHVQFGGKLRPKPSQ